MGLVVLSKLSVAEETITEPAKTCTDPLARGGRLEEAGTGALTYISFDPVMDPLAS